MWSWRLWTGDICGRRESTAHLEDIDRTRTTSPDQPPALIERNAVERDRDSRLGLVVSSLHRIERGVHGPADRRCRDKQQTTICVRTVPQFLSIPPDAAAVETSTIAVVHHRQIASRADDVPCEVSDAFFSSPPRLRSFCFVLLHVLITSWDDSVGACSRHTAGPLGG